MLEKTKVTPGTEEDQKAPVVEEKLTFTQEELDAKLQSESDKRVTEALKTSRATWEADQIELLKTERADAERVALMSVEEKEKELEKRRADDLTSREKTLAQKEIQLKAIGKLDEESLPVSFSELLCGDTEAATFVNIDNFKKAWQSAIDAEVTKRLRGKTPDGGIQPKGSVDMNALIRGQTRRK